MDFIWLFFAHYIGDIALQGSWQAENKRSYWYVMFSHCMVWAACVSVALQFLGIWSLPKVAFMVAGHWLIDRWDGGRPRLPNNARYMYADQGLHLAQLVLVYLL